MWPETDFLSQLIRFTTLDYRKIEEKKIVTVCFSLIFDFAINTTSNQNDSLAYTRTSLSLANITLVLVHNIWTILISCHMYIPTYLVPGCKVKLTHQMALLSQIHIAKQI